MSDPLLGHLVEIHSVGGIVYEGRVRSIKQLEDIGEIFELRSDTSADFQRFIHVVDRLVQIHEIESAPEPLDRGDRDCNR